MFKTSGLSLVEVLVSIFIFAIIVESIFLVLNVADKSWSGDMGLLDLQQQTRSAMDGMVRELRQAKKEITKPITITEDGKKIEFYIPGYDNSISYFLEGSQLIRQHPLDTDKVLANDISILSFCCQHDTVCDTDCSDINTLQIQLQATKTVKQRIWVFPLSAPLMEKVKLRNE